MRMWRRLRGRGTAGPCRQLVEEGVKLPCVAVHEGAEAGQGSRESGGRLGAGQVHGGLAELGGQEVACQVVTGSWAPVLVSHTGLGYRASLEREETKVGGGEVSREA